MIKGMIDQVLHNADKKLIDDVDKDLRDIFTEHFPTGIHEDIDRAKADFIFMIVRNYHQLKAGCPVEQMATFVKGSEE